MPFARLTNASRSFADLSILNCATALAAIGSDDAADSDVADLSEMKDLRSFTGVRSPYRIMAVSTDGTQIMFKKNNSTLYLYTVDDIMQCSDIAIKGVDVCHENDTIFDIAYVEKTQLVVVLQDSSSRFYVFNANLDQANKSLNVASPVMPTNMSTKKHHSAALIFDETGPVLISYPISYPDLKSRAKVDDCEAHPKIELLHLKATAPVRTLSIQPLIRDSNALLCDPFIFRNHLYLFNRFDSTLLCISLSGEGRGDVRLVNTYPDPRYHKPSGLFANKCILVLLEVVLVYCHQRLDKPEEEPQLWKLELGSMNWQRLQLSLNHHFPTGRVCLQRATSEEVAFLHGECGRSACQEKAHLYQLSLHQDCVRSLSLSLLSTNLNTLVEKVGESVRRSLSSSDLHAKPSTSSSSSTPANSSPQPSAPHVPPSMRYANKKNARDKGKRSSSVSVASKLSTASLPDFLPQNGRQYVHWSEEMAHDGGALTLREQLSLAKDMGYTDDEITHAVSMNCAKDGSYRAFSSTNAMIDMLARVQRMYEASSACGNAGGITAADSGLELDNTCAYSSNSHGHSSGVRRAISFHSTSPTRRSHDVNGGMSTSVHEMHYRSGASQFQLQRLLDAFDKEQNSSRDESTRCIKVLEEKCRQHAENEDLLKLRLEEKDLEIQSLKAQLHDQSSFIEQLRNTKAKLDNQLLENKSKSDQIRVLTEQAEVVKRQHDAEIRDKDRMFAELFAKLTATEEANRPAKELATKLQGDIDELMKELSKKQTELDKCSNYHDEIRKAEQQIEEIRMERDEVRSTLSKVPTCVICLDKRPQMLYMPCSHFICCESCGRGFDNCPACRQRICGKITVFQ